LTAILGTTLLRYQGLRALYRVKESLNRGEMPIGEVFTGLCLLVAGALLLTPGFLTDGVGFALFISDIRQAIGSGLTNLLMSRGAVHVSNGHHSGTPYKGPNNPVIDAEFTEVREDADTDARNTPGRDERKE
ncbi:MAG: FxsA family protein, partial [Pseudomonadota bacterium]|nr:FxsA family protein [Pseudomonadota bacterium]